jgi:hypothetical protein
VIERRVYRSRRRDEKQRVGVRRSVNDRFSCDIAAGARPIFDDELPPKML